jgi:uncharacterized protein YyaL (SSP411 family)
VIAWLEWGPAAFARARAEGKPVLLSLTASWCHACHRMDDETWDDPGVAAAVAAAAVPVKVDADARPDVCARYHLGGLPSTLLLDAGGRFVRGATFLSRPALFAFLEQGLAGHAAGRVAEPRPPAGPAARPPAGDLAAETVAWLLRRADAEHGGFGWAPKLPEPAAVALLLRHWRAVRDAGVLRAVRAGLDAVADHLADPRDGGFFRYAAAPDWSGPHTEKVAVEQARLIRLFLEAGVALGETRYTAEAARALAHARRRLADAEGRVLASVAADPDYYADPEGRDDLPAVDRRRFADAGAEMASAAWLGFAVTGEAPGLADEVAGAAPDGLVPHRLDAPGGPAGLLGDQAAAIAASVLRHALTGDRRALDWAGLVAARAVALLWDEEKGAFRAAPADPALELPPMHPVAANAEMGLALAGLAEAAGAPYRSHAERLVQSLAPAARGRAAGPALALVAQRLGAPAAARVEIAGPPGDPRAAALARVAVAALGPHAAVRWGAAGPRPAAVLCAGDLCLPAIADPAALAAALADMELVPRGILVV